MSKFKAGDKVRIKSFKEISKVPNYTTLDYGFVSQMEQFCGKDFVVRGNIGQKCYDLNGAADWTWAEWMLEPVVEKDTAKGIRIKVEKVVKRGRRAYKIISIEALKKNELPPEYIKEGGIFYTETNPREGLFRQTSRDCLNAVVIVGEIYPSDVFRVAILPIIEAAGNRLAEINKRRKAEWSGEVEFKI